MKTGFDKLDEIIELQFGDLVIVQARPGIGKTAFSKTLAQQFSKQHECKNGVLFCTLEIVKEDLFNGDKKVRVLSLRHEELSELVDRTKTEWSKGLEDVIIIDGLQQIAWSRDPDLTIYNYLRELKHIATSMRGIVIITSSSSQEAERRAPAIPGLKDIAYCKSAADIADVVISLNRREFYDKLDKPGFIQIHVVKNRRGDLNECDLVFNKETLFVDDYKPFEIQCGIEEEAEAEFGLFSKK